VTATIAADTASLTVNVPGLRDDQVVSVLLDGRKIWSFRVPATGSRTGDSQLSIDWPATLAERLSGRAVLGLELDGRVVVDSYEVAFGDDDAPLVINDPVTGTPLVVNKWGRLAPSFAGQNPSVIEELLDEAERLVRVVDEHAGIELFVTGGTLLGPIRDGHVMPGDDDVDFAYLSRHENPSDVAVEGFALERVLIEQGYEVIRLSAGHLQLMFPGRSITDKFYIDIFSYFVCNDWFYGTFHARERASDVTLLPLRPVTVNGRQFAGPAEPTELLAAIYGPGWRVPDPSFTFVTPPAAFRRYRGWLDDYNMDRENWEDRHRAEIHRARELQPSNFAVETDALLEPGSTVLELGCGLGADARYFAERGHSVRAVDYSRPALAFAAREGADVDGGAGPARFERINLNSTREVAGLLAECAGVPGPIQVYARGLFEALSAKATDGALLLLRHVLRRPGSRAFVEFEPETGSRGSQWTDYATVDRAELEETAARYGLSIVTAPDRENTQGGPSADHCIIRMEQL
jgi:SAM-dependent methyltransferase